MHTSTLRRQNWARALPLPFRDLNWPRGVVTVLTVLAVFVPLSLIFYQSFLSAPFFMPVKTLGLDAYRFIFDDSDFWMAARNGLILASGLAAIAVPLAACRT